MEHCQSKSWNIFILVTFKRVLMNKKNKKLTRYGRKRRYRTQKDESYSDEQITKNDRAQTWQTLKGIKLKLKKLIYIYQI